MLAPLTPLLLQPPQMCAPIPRPAQIPHHWGDQCFPVSILLFIPMKRINVFSENTTLVEMFASDFHQRRKTGLTAHKFSARPGVGARVRYGGAWGEGVKGPPSG